jgi:CheY-like chemotaxis protein/DNA-binding MarR family transcriptional regulator
MKEKTVLVIDDSATIRRLVDNELSASGYRVVLAGTAEDGMLKAAAERPDLILLDHQLPGTTGFDVCQQLLENSQLCNCPVVVSSTLRKKAYVEYVDASNVVDMLPKPYTPELLITTVANALDTAVMVVQSQSHGSAVPETIAEQTALDLSGTCGVFGVREILDLLNNGKKRGVLELETPECRVWIYIDSGRIQAVTAAGIDPDEVARCMPESLADLAPIVNFTVGGRRCSELDGLVELLDNKVLDSRLLGKLMRIQAAVLIRKCFLKPPTCFRFQANKTSPSLFSRLPLDISLLALLVEGALCCDPAEIVAADANVAFVKKAIRGQNLDRAGLSSAHMQVMGQLSTAMSVDQMAEKLGWPKQEVVQVLHGFELAEWVERQTLRNTCRVIAVTDDPQRARNLHSFFENHRDQFTAQIMNNWLAVGLMMKRKPPQVLLVVFDDRLSVATQQFEQFTKLKTENALASTRFVAWSSGSACAELFAGDDFSTTLNEWNEPQMLAALAGNATADSSSLPTQISQPAAKNIQVTVEHHQTPVLN